MTDPMDVREALAEVLAAWCTGEELSLKPVPGSKPCSRDFARADAILSDPSLVVLRREDVEQVGWRVRDDGPVSTRGSFRRYGDSTMEPVYRLKGWQG